MPCNSAALTVTALHATMPPSLSLHAVLLVPLRWCGGEGVQGAAGLVELDLQSTGM